MLQTQEVLRLAEILVIEGYWGLEDYFSSGMCPLRSYHAQRDVPTLIHYSSTKYTLCMWDTQFRGNSDSDG